MNKKGKTNRWKFIKQKKVERKKKERLHLCFRKRSTMLEKVNGIGKNNISIFYLTDTSK